MAAALALGLTPTPASAQHTGGCGIELRGGARLAYPHAVADGSPIDDMETGVALAFEASCPVSERWRGGLDVEANTGPNLSVIHFLAVGERAVWTSADGYWTLALRGAAGWAFTESGLGASSLLAPAGGRAIEEGRNGPALGLGGRAEARLSRALRLLFDAGWRGSWVKETIFTREEETRGILLHVFPVTIGLGLRF